MAQTIKVGKTCKTLNIVGKNINQQIEITLGTNGWVRIRARNNDLNLANITTVYGAFNSTIFMLKNCNITKEITVDNQ